MVPIIRVPGYKLFDFWESGEPVCVYLGTEIHIILRRAEVGSGYVLRTYIGAERVGSVNVLVRECSDMLDVVNPYTGEPIARFEWADY